MTFCRARIQRVKFSIHNSIKRHRASPRANHRGENQSKSFPARPAAMVARRHEHRRQRERQREDGMRETHERTPFLNCRKHHKLATESQRHREKSLLNTLWLCVSVAKIIPFLRSSAGRAGWTRRDDPARARRRCPQVQQLFLHRRKNSDSPAK